MELLAFPIVLNQLHYICMIIYVVKSIKVYIYV